MQILINKSGRVVKLTKRERDLLGNAKALLAELSTVGGGDVAASAESAADEIGLALVALSAANKEVAKS